MKRLEQRLQDHYKAESDELLLFGQLTFDDNMKNRVVSGLKTIEHMERENTTDAVKLTIAARTGKDRNAATASGKTWRLRGKWAYGAAAAVMLLAVAVSIPLLNGNGGLGAIEHPGAGDAIVENGGGVDTPDASQGGSQLSQLTTVNVKTAEEAKLRFGDDLRVPAYVPEGYSLDTIETTGMDPNKATRVVFYYNAGDRTYTYMEDRSKAVIPEDMFDEIKVNGTNGLVFTQPGMTELYWLKDGVQHAIVGPLTQEEAIRVAESLN